MLLRKNTFFYKLIFCIALFEILIPLKHSFTAEKLEDFTTLSPALRDRTFQSLLARIREEKKVDIPEVYSIFDKYQKQTVVDAHGNNLAHRLLLEEKDFLLYLPSLMDLGIDLTSRNIEGFSLLETAVLFHHKEVVDAFIKNSIDISDFPPKNRNHLLHLLGNWEEEDTALLKAILHKNPKLLERKNHLGETPLFFYVAKQKKALTMELLKQGANPNARNQVGQTPLHMAAKNQDLEMTKLLVSFGANVNLQDAPIDQPSSVLDMAMKNTPGWTPLQTAEDLRSQNPLIDYLIKKGARPAHKPFDRTFSVYGNYQISQALKNIETGKSITAQYLGASLLYHWNLRFALGWEWLATPTSHPTEGYYYLQTPGVLPTLQQFFSLFQTNYTSEIHAEGKGIFYTLLLASIVLPQSFSYFFYNPSTPWLYYGVHVNLGSVYWHFSDQKDHSLMIDLGGKIGGQANFFINSRFFVKPYFDMSFLYTRSRFSWDGGILLGMLF